MTTERYVVLVAAAFLAIACPALAQDACLSKCPTHKGPFGQPEPDRQCVLKCLQGEEQPAPPTKGGADPQAPTPPSLRLTENWQGSEQLRRQQRSLQSLIDAIPDAPFRTWAVRNVTFDRVSQGSGSWVAGVRPGVLTLYDSFWAQKRAMQESVLAFELAKALWFERINPGPREARPPREIEFEALLRRHQNAIEAMRFAAWHGEDLGHLTDRDSQSWFSYAYRAAVFNLPPPSQAPRGYSSGEWSAVQKDWQQAKSDVKRYVASLLASL